MWTSLALTAALALAPAQTGTLRLTNIRTTNGFLGAARADNKFLPGDVFCVAYDIEGIRADEEGKVQYSMGMEVTDAQNKVIFKEDPKDLTAVNSLGGNRLPAFAHVVIGADQPVGDYTLKLTVKDRTANAAQTFTRAFTVLRKDFGLIGLNTSLDPQGNLNTPPVGTAGQVLYVNFAVIGFQRDTLKKQPHVTMEMRVLDEAGKPTVGAPFKGEILEVADKAVAWPMQYPLILNRAGKFTVELQATDRITKKTSKLNFPVTVLDNK